VNDFQSIVLIVFWPVVKVNVSLHLEYLACFCYLGDAESSAPGVMVKACRLGDGESLRQAFAISVLKCETQNCPKMGRQ
jgi:hypothetical protein